MASRVAFSNLSTSYKEGIYYVSAVVYRFHFLTARSLLVITTAATSKAISPRMRKPNCVIKKVVNNKVILIYSIIVRQ